MAVSAVWAMWGLCMQPELTAEMRHGDESSALVHWYSPAWEDARRRSEGTVTRDLREQSRGMVGTRSQTKLP